MTRATPAGAAVPRFPGEVPLSELLDDWPPPALGPTPQAPANPAQRHAPRPAPAAPALTRCEECGTALDAGEVEEGFRRCEACDPNGGHITDPTTGRCAVIGCTSTDNLRAFVTHITSPLPPLAPGVPPRVIGPDTQPPPGHLVPGVVVWRHTDHTDTGVLVPLPCHDEQHVALAIDEATRACVCRTCGTTYAVRLLDEQDGGHAAECTIIATHAAVSSPRNVTTTTPTQTGRCHCGQPLPTQPATGRRPRHCSPACRQAAYRQRHARGPKSPV